MFGWLLNLHKCFGSRRDQSPEPENQPQPPSQPEAQEDLTHVAVEEEPAWVRVERESQPGEQEAIEDEAGETPGSEGLRNRRPPPSIMDQPQPAASATASGVPAMRASPLIKDPKRRMGSPQMGSQLTKDARERPGAPRNNSPLAKDARTRTMSPRTRSPLSSRGGRGGGAGRQGKGPSTSATERITPPPSRPASGTGSPRLGVKARVDSNLQGRKQSPRVRTSSPSSTSGRHPQSEKGAQVTKSVSRPASSSSPQKPLLPAASHQVSPKLRPLPSRAGQVSQPSRLSLQTPAPAPEASRRHSANLEDRPIQLHLTPFDVRVERSLQRASGGKESGRLGEDGSPAAEETLQGRHSNAGSPHRRLSASPQRRAAGSPRLKVTGAKENSPPSFGKKNLSLPAADASSHPSLAAPYGGTKPKLQVQLPSIAGLMASTPLTPSSPQNLRFVMDKDDSFGTPQVVGVDNLSTQYREDKRLRVHETPFELRVERFMHKEQQFMDKEQAAKARAQQGEATLNPISG